MNDYPDHAGLRRYLDATANDPRTYPHYAAVLEVAKDTGHISNWYWYEAYSPPFDPATLPAYAQFQILLPDVQSIVLEAATLRPYLTDRTRQRHTNQGDTHG